MAPACTFILVDNGASPYLRLDVPGESKIFRDPFLFQPTLALWYDQRLQAVHAMQRAIKLPVSLTIVPRLTVTVGAVKYLQASGPPFCLRAPLGLLHVMCLIAALHEQRIASMGHGSASNRSHHPHRPAGTYPTAFLPP